MLRLSQSSNRGQFGVLFDIGSASIGTAIVSFENNSSKVLWYRRHEYGFHTGDDYNRYVRTMYATLLEAGMKVTSEGFSEIKAGVPEFTTKDLEVYCVLAPPWFLGAIHTEEIVKETPFHITSAVLKKIKETGLSKVLSSQESLSWQDLMGSPELLESYNDSIKIEGYPVESYEHVLVKELTVQSYYGIVSTSVQEHIEDVIEKIFPNHNLSFSTSTRVLSGVEDYMHLPKSTQRSILIEIEEEITNLSLMQKGVLMNTVSIPKGTNHIVHSVAPDAVSAHEARSILEVLHKKNKDVEFEALPKNLHDSLLLWKEHVTESLSTLSNGVTPPTEVLLFSDSFWYSLYKKAIEIPWNMPGIRRNITVDVIPVDIIANSSEDSTTKKTRDVRLTVFSYLLSHYTR